jgi:plastocyanin
LPAGRLTAAVSASGEEAAWFPRGTARFPGVLLGLTNAQRFGLAAVAFVFIAFSLLCALLIPRYRPDFPGGRNLRLFIAVVVVLLVAMLGAVEVFAREEEEPHEEAAAAETTEAGDTAPTTTEAAPTTGGETAPSTTGAAPTTAQDGETTLENPADPSALRFEKSALEASAGTVTLVMENPSAIEHNIAVRGEGLDEKGEVVGQGEESTVTVELEPGEYEFYCSVPGHEEAGMKGTLTVGS